MKRIIRALSFRILRAWVIVKAYLIMYFFSTPALLRFLKNSDKRFIAVILRSFGASIQTPVNFNGHITIDNASESKSPFQNLIIGKKCFIGTGAFFDLPGKIILEENVVISAGVKILTHQDCGDRPMSQFYPRKVADVIIEKNSWIGVNAIILAGVTVGENSVIAAGAVITKNIEPYSVIAGNPARLVKKLIN
ncbi:MAG: acyltransferase [Bacteroidales bacterium]|nr:acyltransferase [Bacteroidales bacterium]